MKFEEVPKFEENPAPKMEVINAGILECEKLNGAAGEITKVLPIQNYQKGRSFFYQQGALDIAKKGIETIAGTLSAENPIFSNFREEVLSLAQEAVDKVKAAGGDTQLVTNITRDLRDSLVLMQEKIVLLENSKEELLGLLEEYKDDTPQVMSKYDKDPADVLAAVSTLSGQIFDGANKVLEGEKELRRLAGRF
jgi:hypothetical protein